MLGRMLLAEAPKREEGRFFTFSARAFGLAAFAAALFSVVAAAVVWPLHHLAAIVIAVAGATIVLVLGVIWRSMMLPTIRRFAAYAAEIELERERFERLFTKIPDIGILWDIDGILQQANAPARELFGDGGGDGTAFRIIDCVTAERRDEVQRYFARALKGDAVEFETLALGVHAQRIPVWATFVPIISGGAVVGVFGIAKDLRPLRILERELLFETERFRSLFDINYEPMLQLGADRHILRANAAFERISGYGSDELVGETSALFSATGSEDIRENAYRRVMAGEAFEAESQLRCKDGHVLPVIAALIPMAHGTEIEGYYIIMRDLSAQRAFERREELTREKLRELYRLATVPQDELEPLLARVLDFGRRILEMEIGYVLGIDGDDFVIRAKGGSGRFALGDRVPIVRAISRQLLKNETPLVINDIRESSFHEDVAAEGEPWRCFLGAPITVEGIRFGALAFSSKFLRETPFDANDVDFVKLMAALLGSAFERDRRARTLGDLALRDPLTGLANRTLLAQRLEREIVRTKRNGGELGILFLDLDGFKSVNDRFGHAVGDRILAEVGHRLVGVVRGDELVARIGGDEFVVVLNDLRSDSLDRCTARIEKAMREPFAEIDLPVGISVGPAIFGLDGNDPSSLLAAADAKMYQAKQARRPAGVR
uniref:Diguanylate cyclase n=1 Tax=mine drainage metagenome TaxID=410659 RepID=E6PIP0_9ZZZZ